MQGIYFLSTKKVSCVPIVLETKKQKHYNQHEPGLAVFITTKFKQNENPANWWCRLHRKPHLD